MNHSEVDKNTLVYLFIAIWNSISTRESSLGKDASNLLLFHTIICQNLLSDSSWSRRPPPHYELLPRV